MLFHWVKRAVIGTTFLALSATAIVAFAAEPGGIELDEYRGKVVLLDFWASWCVPCRHSFPWMQQMHDRYGQDGLVVIAVNLDNDVAAAKSFLNKYPVEFDIVFDQEQSAAREYDIVAMPSSIIIGRDGDVVTRHRGFKAKKKADYEQEIIAALEAKDLVVENQ